MTCHNTVVEGQIVSDLFKACSSLEVAEASSNCIAAPASIIFSEGQGYAECEEVNSSYVVQPEDVFFEAAEGVDYSEVCAELGFAFGKDEPWYQGRDGEFVTCSEKEQEVRILKADALHVAQAEPKKCWDKLNAVYPKSGECTIVPKGGYMSANGCKRACLKDEDCEAVAITSRGRDIPMSNRAEDCEFLTKCNTNPIKGPQLDHQWDWSHQKKVIFNVWTPRDCTADNVCLETWFAFYPELDCTKSTYTKRQSLEECNKRCTNNSKCQGVVWGNTHYSLSKNKCYEYEDCTKGKQYDPNWKFNTGEMEFIKSVKSRQGEGPTKVMTGRNRWDTIAHKPCDAKSFVENWGQHFYGDHLTTPSGGNNYDDGVDLIVDPIPLGR